MRIANSVHGRVARPASFRRNMTKTLLQMLQEMVGKYESTIGPMPERNA